MLKEHFSYYKDEAECPFSNSSNEAIFWDCEKTFKRTVEKEFECQLLKEAEALTDRLQHENELDELQKKFLSYSREKKALALYVVQMLQKFCPYNGDEILIHY